MESLLSVIQEPRSKLIRETGFDVYRSPKFIETLVCRLAALRQTGHHDVCDAVTQSGELVEIKSAILSRRTRYNYDSFVFSQLQGWKRRGKNAGVYVLVGIQEERLRFFVLPSVEVGKRPSIEINVTQKHYRKNSKWLQWEVSEQALRHEIERMAMINSQSLRSSTT